MPDLLLRSAKSCRWDCVSLGEVMLRLDPGDGRVHTTRTFQVWEGGGEYNVARGLKRCFGLRTAVVTALADNPVGRLVEDLMFQGGVEQRVKWAGYDGVGRTVRNGLNFTERGFGVRAALGCSDRGHTAISQLGPGEIDWEEIFGRLGARWFHTGGIFCALSETTPAVAHEAMDAARRRGAIVSFDLNYREKLWRAAGGAGRAVAVLGRIVEHVDVLVGNEEDLQKGLGIPGPKVTAKSKLDRSTFVDMMERVVARFPNMKIVATTLREVHSTTRHEWAAVAWAGGQTYVSPTADLHVYDRVGGGDGFASGFFYGLMSGATPEDAVRLGWAHGALLTTFPGDTTMATLDQVVAFAKGESARIQR